VHFLRGDPPETIGRKAVRRALSDLAAKAAEPDVYLLALALPEWPDTGWLRAFADGLAADQEEFGIALAGGETDATPGPVTITVTAIGHTPNGELLRRNGAKPGDTVFVTGTIGDAAAGLMLARGEIKASGAAREFLLSRFRIPVPRLAFGRALRGIASAAIDVSDGLLADLGHIAETSDARIEVDAARIPLSESLGEFAGADMEARAAIAGDDYEIAFTAAPANEAAIMAAARETSTQVTAIGRVVTGQRVALLGGAGQEIGVAKQGYTHF
jgi:thiamine-monophosphate kinase